jgi:HEAT repeat protein
MKEAVVMVERGLQDKDQEVRQTAAATPGEMGAQDAIPNLKQALDDSPEVSFTAAKALWKLDDTESSRHILQEVLEGERKDAPGRLHGALRNAKKKMTPGQLALMGVKEGSGAFLGPASIGVTAIQEAIKEKKADASAAGRSVAAELLSKDTEPYSLTLLEWAVGDNSWAVRLAVAKGLGERGNQGTIAKLRPLLSDDHHAVRYMAAASIVKLSQKKPAATGD